jgi:hypothetical protein
MVYSVTGVVPMEPECVHLADGDVVTKRTWPCWGMDIKCGQNADFNYGPWVDRQRFDGDKFNQLKAITIIK